jgi:DNA-binding transcriptional MerR regulator
VTGFGSDELITIGVLARASGLTPSALRFYDDCGLLVPVRVDGSTGYRYYSESQCERAVMIRRLRGIGVPLEVVAEVLSGDVERAERLLDEHVLDLEQRARKAALVAAAVKEALGDGADLVALSGAALADAIDQVRSAAAHSAEIPVLAGVLVEASPSSLTLTATDRYRLSTRTLAPRRGGTWSLVVDAGELGAVSSWLRSVDEVVAAATDGALVLAAGGTERRCQAINEPFPDYRALLSELAPVRTRVVVGRELLLGAFDGNEAATTFSIDATGMTVSQQDSRPVRQLPAIVTGSDIDLAFSPATLAPAIRSAVGPEIMLDISAPDQPVVVRSATDGDLTTLVMPTINPNTTEPEEHS